MTASTLVRVQAIALDMRIHAEAQGFHHDSRSPAVYMPCGSKLD